jgi:hypothetical protein
MYVVVWWWSPTAVVIGRAINCALIHNHCIHRIFLILVGFEVLTAVIMKCSIFCNITPYSPLKVRSASHLLHVGFLLGLFNPEDGGNMFVPNVDRLLTDYTALYPRIYKCFILFSWTILTEMHTEFWCWKPLRNEHLKDRKGNGDNFTIDSKKYIMLLSCRMWRRVVWHYCFMGACCPNHQASVFSKRC